MPSHQPSHQPARLTKKQKKATAFRERGGGKFKSKGKGGPNPTSGRRARPSTGDNGEEEDDDEDANAVPAMEDQDQALVMMAGDTEGHAQGHGEGRAVRVPKTAVSMGSTAAQKKKNDGDSKKRRRGNAEEESEEWPASKRTKLARGSDRIPPVAPDEDETAGMTVVKGSDGEHGSETKNKESKAQRYILFIGNLKYTTTHEAIQNHFSLCDPPPTVRLLTPKVTRAGATVAKSKGCAFLEFSARPALQAALRLHQSELDGRRINVELTAGGGGKGDARLAKVKARNKQLAAQRTRRTVKAVTAQGKGTTQDEGVQSQRFSTTSGEGDVPRTKRTWSVGDEADEGQRGEHRRRTKAGKKRGTRTKNWGTGVNALPIG